MVLALDVIGLVTAVVVSLTKPAGPLAEPEPMTRVEYPIDVNTATFVELTTVPQIGPATADQILDRRPFETLDLPHGLNMDCKNIHGLARC